MNLQPVGAAAVRENHDVGVRRRDEEVADEILLARAHPNATLAAAALHAIGGDRRALDVAGVGDGNRHVFVGDQVLDAEFATLVDDVVRRSSPNRSRIVLQLVDDELDQQLVAREDRAQALDRLHQLGELVDNLLPLQPGQPLELHVEDRLRLDRR